MAQIKHLIKRLFQYEARLILKKYKPKIIAITGSVGKTTTKDLLYPILSRKLFVRKSEKSFTAELGVPLAIIGCPYGKGSILDWIKNIFIGLKLLIFRSHYPEWLVLELDGDKPGDLNNLSNWLSPNILVITEIGSVPSHIETFDSDLGKFLSEKRNLINSVVRDGLVIYNSDDEIVTGLISNCEVRKISCGSTPECDFSMSDFTLLYGTEKTGSIPTGMFFEILFDGKSLPISIFSTFGKGIQFACLMVMAVCKELNIGSEESIPILSKSHFLPGRMKILSGIKNSVLVDDSYNSSPVAMAQALDVFKKIDTVKRKIVVVGDMLELGKFSADEHKTIGKILKEIASYVICVGIRSRKISDELLSLGFPSDLISNFDTSIEAGKFLQNYIQDGDFILIKGSQAMRMERVVEEVMRHPEDKDKLLVRQDEEWIDRE